MPTALTILGSSHRPRFMTATMRPCKPRMLVIHARPTGSSAGSRTTASCSRSRISVELRRSRNRSLGHPAYAAWMVAPSLSLLSRPNARNRLVFSVSKSRSARLTRLESPGRVRLLIAPPREAPRRDRGQGGEVRPFDTGDQPVPSPQTGSVSRSSLRPKQAPSFRGSENAVAHF